MADMYLDFKIILPIIISIFISIYCKFNSCISRTLQLTLNYMYLDIQIYLSNKINVLRINSFTNIKQQCTIMMNLGV